MKAVKKKPVPSTGNTMIGTLLKQVKKTDIILTLQSFHVHWKLTRSSLDKVIMFFGKPVIFPVHPRTAKMIKQLGIHHPRLHMVDPMSYLEFNYLVKSARLVITDSGGITEETTVMHIPCITLRTTTERPETVTMGTNELIGTDPKAIAGALEKCFSGNWKTGSIPPLWDGKTADRIVKNLQYLN